MPYMSNASRSNQSAHGQMPDTLGTAIVSSVSTFMRMRWFSCIDSR